MRDYRILLISMPWQRADAPSLQLGLLKASLIKAGFQTQALHTALLLCRKLGNNLYWRMASNIPPLLAETGFAFIRGYITQNKLADLLFETEEFGKSEIVQIIEGIIQFCKELLFTAPWRNFDIVGFTCTFNQLQASLWAAAEAKKSGCKTIFGGFLAQGGMGEELACNNEVDTVIDGPGEQAFIDWLRLHCPSGIFKAEPCSLPPLIPDYSDYLAAWKNIPEIREKIGNCSMILEASRGCEHGSCAFCAQNHQKGRKDYSREYIEQCLDKYSGDLPGTELEFADTSFPFPLLAQMRKQSPLHSKKKNWQAFAECRCPTPRQMRQFGEAGFKSIQVGVESLHTNILKKMRKGVTLLHNICCLREAWNSGLTVHYNIILDMPGTLAREIEEMLRLLPLLYHLPPPDALVSFQLQRNSRVFLKPSQYGLKNIQPHELHKYLGSAHPPFYFSFDNQNPLPPSLLEEAHLAFKAWEEAFDEESPLLYARCSRFGAIVIDRRFSSFREVSLSRQAARMLMACRKPRKSENLVQLGKAYSPDLLLELTELNFLLEDNGSYLTLPVLLSEFQLIPSQARRDPMDSWFSPSRISEKGQG